MHEIMHIIGTCIYMYVSFLHPPVEETFLYIYIIYVVDETVYIYMLHL